MAVTTRPATYGIAKTTNVAAGGTLTVYAGPKHRSELVIGVER